MLFVYNSALTRGLLILRWASLVESVPHVTCVLTAEPRSGLTSSSRSLTHLLLSRPILSEELLTPRALLLSECELTWLNDTELRFVPFDLPAFSFISEILILMEFWFSILSSDILTWFLRMAWCLNPFFFNFQWCRSQTAQLCHPKVCAVSSCLRASLEFQLARQLDLSDAPFVHSVQLIKNGKYYSH